MRTAYLMLHFNSGFLPREGQKIHCTLVIFAQVQAFVFNVSFEKRFYPEGWGGFCAFPNTAILKSRKQKKNLYIFIS